ncbi:MAG TPA: hypothetical protein VHB50_15135 [Bryobacteraceae bacterium]|nr:hypothetical protein [Bryobacteraceae bacterium]
MVSLSLKAAPLLDEGYRQMYNLRFAEAHRTFAQYERESPADAMAPLSDAAAYLFSEFDRLNILQAEFWTQDESFLDFHKPDADPAVRSRFEAALEKTHRLAEAGLKRDPNDANALLAATLRLGLHADYLALIEKRNFAALAEVKQARLLAEQLLARHPDCYDAWIAVGIENYLLSLKPAPIRWILHASGSQTDRQTGIDKLRLTAEKGHYLLPYARLLLAVADLRDHAPERAKARLQWLANEFPGNRLYREELAKLH